MALDRTIAHDLLSICASETLPGQSLRQKAEEILENPAKRWNTCRHSCRCACCETGERRKS